MQFLKPLIFPKATYFSETWCLSKQTEKSQLNPDETFKEHIDNSLDRERANVSIMQQLGNIHYVFVYRNILSFHLEHFHYHFSSY